MCLSFQFYSAVDSVAQESEDKSLSPYFQILNEGPSIDNFPLLTTEVQVNLTDWMAEVTVQQIYKNLGEVPIDASYIFPASTRAAVHHLEVKIGNRTIEAEIMEKQKARERYENAGEEGYRAALLEQHRINVFEMSVTNIVPGDEILVTLKYHELIKPERGTYQFVYPAVVGPRYISEAADPEEIGFTQVPYLAGGDQVVSDWKIEVEIISGKQIEDILCRSHTVATEWQNGYALKVALDPSEIASANKDFILEYRLNGKKPTSSVLLYEHEDEKFFLTTIYPPAIFQEQEIIPREYILVVDVSGSMIGFPLDISKEFLRQLISSLRPEDQFNIVLFAGASALLSPKSLSANTRNIDQAIRFLDAQEGGGGTELLPALQTAFDLPKGEGGLSRSIIVVTDGYVAVEAEAFQMISDQLGSSNLFAFGIGSSVNRFLVEGLSHMGRGEAFVITDPTEAPQVLERFTQYIKYPLMTNVAIEWNGIEPYDIIPTKLPDLFSEKPLYLIGKYRGEPDGFVKVSGRIKDGNFVEEILFDSSNLRPQNIGLRTLWAREKIKWLHDFNHLEKTREREEVITKLGLQYHLLTDYTSFVAIDKLKVLDNGTETILVKQPLPLPHGVSDFAIGFEMSVNETISHEDPGVMPSFSVLISGVIPSVRTHLEAEVENLLMKESPSVLDGLSEIILICNFDLMLQKWCITADADALYAIRKSIGNYLNERRDLDLPHSLRILIYKS